MTRRLLQGVGTDKGDKSRIGASVMAEQWRPSPVRDEQTADGAGTGGVAGCRAGSCARG